mgnify:CR=1 FL=1
MTDAIACPECMKTATRVIDSRPSYDRGSVRRSRKCSACGCRWTTYEVDADRLALLEDQIRPTNEAKGAGITWTPTPSD